MGPPRRDRRRTFLSIPAAYPESPMFGKLPARLLFARHVTGLQTHDVSLEASQATDAQAIIHVDVIENPLAVARP